MIEVMEAARVIMGVLEGNAIITDNLGSNDNPGPSIYLDLAPQGAVMPYITLQYIPDGPEYRFGTDQSLAMAELTFLVKVTTEGEDQILALNLSANIDGTLNSIRQTVSNGIMLDIYRRSIFYQPLVEDGKRYTQAGGRYTVLARPAI